MRTRLKSAARDDSGATLIFALLIITVVALVSAGVLFLGDTSTRTTVKMRDVASAAYAGDAAAEVALNQLRNDTFNGVASGCDTSTTEVLSNLYPATATAVGASAAVTCSSELTFIPSKEANTSPGNAILTLATGSEIGIQLTDSNNKNLRVGGGIVSNSTIDLSKPSSDLENIDENSWVYAYGPGACTGQGDLIVTSSSKTNCNVPADPLPNDWRRIDPVLMPGHGTSFDAPTTVGPPQNPTACAAGEKVKKVYTLQPGLYTDAAVLTGLTDCAGGSVVYLTPGMYFFDFPDGTPTWDISKGYLVGGNVPPTSTTPNMGAACTKPDAAGAGADTGVQLMFGGPSRFALEGSGNVELCASRAASGSPIVFRGLANDVVSGTTVVHRQSGCLVSVPYDAAGCPVLTTDKSKDFELRLWGTVYAPKAAVDITMHNSNIITLAWGAVSRVVRFAADGSPTITNHVIDSPSTAPLPYTTLAQRFLSVYICPGSATCSTAGTLRLRASVIVGATAPRTINVTSWSTIR